MLNKFIGINLNIYEKYEIQYLLSIDFNKVLKN